MPATLRVTLDSLRLPMLGMGRIDILLDEVVVLSLALGDSGEVEIAPGTHCVKAVLHGVLTRVSKPLDVALEEGGSLSVRGRYSRLWGTMKLSLG